MRSNVGRTSSVNSSARWENGVGAPCSGGPSGRAVSGGASHCDGVVGVDDENRDLARLQNVVADVSE